jgi:NitT/TauT family transport system substrate-binding protein
MFRLLMQAIVLAAISLAASAQNKNLTPVVMQLNWHPQADFGGYFAAKAEGIYEKHGLDVTIKQGGPQMNIHQLLAAGSVDFVMGTSVRTLMIRSQGVPIVSVAAFYQIDPVTILVHDGSGINSPADLKGRQVYLPGIARINYWPLFKVRYGLDDAQIRPFDPSYRAFSLDKATASQGYLTEDGYRIKKLGINGKSMLLADHGWVPYSSTLDATEKTLTERAKMVEEFVKATAEGYRRYLENPTAAHALIRKTNPDMDEEQMRYAYSVMKGRGLVDPGNGVKIGSMTDARWEATYKLLAESGMLPADFDYRKAYTLRFVKEL